MSNSQIIATGKTKYKKTARGHRIWLEGGKLAKAGFSRNDHYTRTTGELAGSPFVMFHREDKQTTLKVAGRERNGKTLPIIDYVSSEALFDSGAALAVEYRQGLITITQA